jgi:hypothetical protein
VRKAIVRSTEAKRRRFEAAQRSVSELRDATRKHTSTALMANMVR